MKNYIHNIHSTGARIPVCWQHHPEKLCLPIWPRKTTYRAFKLRRLIRISAIHHKIPLIK